MTAQSIPALANALTTSDCPPPETFLDEEWRALSALQRDKFTTHVTQCSVCQTERMLAAAFDAAHDGATRQRVWGAQWYGALAATVAVFAVGISLWSLRPGPTLPPLPTRDSATSVARGAAIQLLAPSGEHANAPAQFRWSPVVNATRYTVSVRNVVGEVIWTHDTSQTTAPMPDKLRVVNVLRYWDVRAFNDADETLARSGEGSYTVQFEETP